MSKPEFVYHMEDVLDVYTQPYDLRRPQVCLDETSVQLVAETRIPLPMAPGRPARYDYEVGVNAAQSQYGPRRTRQFIPEMHRVAALVAARPSQ